MSDTKAPAAGDVFRKVSDTVKAFQESTDHRVLNTRRAALQALRKVGTELKMVERAIESDQDTTMRILDFAADLRDRLAELAATRRAAKSAGATRREIDSGIKEAFGYLATAEQDLTSARKEIEGKNREISKAKADAIRPRTTPQKPAGGGGGKAPEKIPPKEPAKAGK